MKKESKFTDILRNRPESGRVPEAAQPPARRGRPGGKGKRLNPDYAQVTAYIPRKLHEETKIRLIQQGNREFSELIFDLLLDWNLIQSKSDFAI